MAFDVLKGQSWDAAYATAALGQVLTVEPGDHGQQLLTRKAAKDVSGTGPRVTFDGAGQVQVGLTLGNDVENNNAPSHLETRGITGRPGSQLVIRGGNAKNIVIDGFSAAAFYVNGAQDLVLRNGDFDPRPAAAPQIPNSKVDRNVKNKNIRLERLKIHNYTFGPQCMGYGGTFDCHGEGLIIFGGEGIVVRECEFWDNWTYHIFCQWNADQWPAFSLSVEDCNFGVVRDRQGRTRDTALTFGSNALANIAVLRNDFAPGQRLVDENAGRFTNVRVEENVFRSSARYIPGVTYNRNWWTSGAQGTDQNGEPSPEPPPPPPPPPEGLTLRLLSETVSKLTLGWDPVPGAIGYRFQSQANAPKWSHTWDTSRTSVVFSKGDGPYKVDALGRIIAGEYAE